MVGRSRADVIGESEETGNRSPHLFCLHSPVKARGSGKWGDVVFSDAMIAGRRVGLFFSLPPGLRYAIILLRILSRGAAHEEKG